MTSNKSEDTPARVRFAPSPTGMFHVGSARTALFNWLWARHTGGQFILRVEDTDQSRTTDDALDSLMDGLEWLGLDWDEGPGVGGPCGPYVQSERLETYSSHVDMLVADAQAYRCFCTPERLASLREQGLKSYDRHCRDLTVDQVEEKLEGGETAVIRFRVPFEGTTTITDKVRGDITTKNPVIDDFVILKSDGFPTYHLANIVDDQLMGITHVLRGEEWIPSTPKHVLLYQAFGWQPPVFVHVPVIQGKDGKKLSKRHGAMAVTDYREGGLLPEAVVNFVALLGWSPGDDREHMRLDELVAAFSIDRILAKPAVFDEEKLEWLNGEYLSNAPAEELFDVARQSWVDEGLVTQAECVERRDYLLKVIDLVKSRLRRTSDFSGFVGYFLSDPAEYEPKIAKKRWKPDQTALMVAALADSYETLDPFTESSTEETLRTCAESAELSAGALIHPVRLAVSGVGIGPSLFEMLEVLGREAVVKRLRAAVAQLG